ARSIRSGIERSLLSLTSRSRGSIDRTALDLRVLRVHLRPERGGPRRRRAARHGLRGHPGRLVLSGLRRPQARLLTLRRLISVALRRPRVSPCPVRRRPCVLGSLASQPSNDGAERRAPASSGLAVPSTASTLRP